jgi:hypothetical protein
MSPRRPDLVGAVATIADVGKVADVAGVRDVALRRFGRIDPLCNNAEFIGRVTEMTLEDGRGSLR